MTKITLIALLLSCCLITKAQDQEKKNKSGEWRQGIGIENVIGSWINHCWNLNLAATKEKHQFNAGLKIPVSILSGLDFKPQLSLDFSYEYTFIDKFWASPYLVGGIETMYAYRNRDLPINNGYVMTADQTTISSHFNFTSPYLGLGLRVKLFDRIHLTADCSYAVGFSTSSAKIRVSETDELLEEVDDFRFTTGNLFHTDFTYSSYFTPIRWSLGATYFFGGKKSDKKKRSN